jgi:hypothetical protein
LTLLKYLNKRITPYQVYYHRFEQLLQYYYLAGFSSLT